MLKDKNFLSSSLFELIALLMKAENLATCRFFKPIISKFGFVKKTWFFADFAFKLFLRLIFIEIFIYM